MAFQILLDFCCMCSGVAKVGHKLMKNYVFWVSSAGPLLVVRF